MKIETINIFALVTIPLSILAIVYGIVDWPVVCLIWLMKFELNVKIR